MTEEKVTERSQHELPFKRTLKLQDVVHDGGLRMLRMTFREGRRFTIIDLDQSSATEMANELTNWAKDPSHKS